MCDYSLQSVKTRDAVVGDKLIINDFGTGTRGFAGVDDGEGSIHKTAVCLLPGTELAFDEPIEQSFSMVPFNKDGHRVARFRQIHKDVELAHHDAVELPNGERSVLSQLRYGLTATVLQLPAKPKTEAEAEEQKRLPVKA